MSHKLKSLFILHILLMFYSITGVLSKYAADADFLSFRFCLLYLGVLVILGIYAIGWQQILKMFPLTTAFSNKAVTVVWGIIWGILFFGESINIFKILGALLIIGGVVLYTYSDKSDEMIDAETDEVILHE